jgi:hypothetical protein
MSASAGWLFGVVVFVTGTVMAGAPEGLLDHRNTPHNAANKGSGVVFTYYL